MNQFDEWWESYANSLPIVEINAGDLHTVALVAWAASRQSVLEEIRINKEKANERV